MIGPINFNSRHEGTSGDILNSIINRYKAYTKKVSADTFVEFVQNEISYNIHPGRSIFDTTFLYFYIESVKLDEHKVLLIHPNSVDEYKLAVTVVILRDDSFKVTESVIIDTNDMSAESHKTIVLNDNRVFIAHCYGGGSSFLEGKIVGITYAPSTNTIDVSVHSASLSNNRGSSGWINAFKVADNKIVIVHEGDNGVAIGAPAAQIVTINENDFICTSDTYLTENEMSYSNTYACMVEDDRILVVHSSDDTNHYLDALVFRYKTKDTYAITPGSNIRIETTQYAAQGCRCIYFKDKYALITYDDSDALSGELVMIDGLNITKIKKVNICANAGSYEHEILQLSDSSFFITYCSDTLERGWNYNIYYLVGNNLISDVSGTLNNIPWPTSGTSALALTRLTDDYICVFYADTDNKTQLKIIAIDNKDIEYNTPCVNQNLRNSSGIIKIADNKLFFTYAYSDDTVTGRLYSGVLDTTNDNIQVISTQVLVDEDNSVFMESKNHRMILNQIIDNKAEIILLYNKRISQNNYDLYYGIVNVDLTTNNITFINKSKLNDVDQDTASNSIIKISDDYCLITMTNDAQSGYLYGRLFRMQYDANNKFVSLSDNSINDIVISDSKNSNWMHNFINMDDSTIIFFFRDYDDSMKIKASIISIDLNSSNVINIYSKDTLVVNSSEAAMCIQPVKVSNEKIILFACDYDSSQGAWGAWYLGAIIVLYNPSTHSLSTPSNLSRVSTYDTSNTAVIALNNEDVIYIYEEYDSSHKVVLSARKVRSIYSKLAFVSDPVVIDNTNTFTDSMFTVELEEGRHLLVHPNNYSNFNFTAQILYTPNFIGPSIKEADSKIDGLSKTDISMTEEGEVYTKL